MTAPIVTLLSDFGLKDPYVAEMKAVISTISPETRITDISHLIEKFNIRMGAFVLASAAHYFPKGAIHVAVVDPGVGTKRRALLVETKHAFYIGPDNGLLMLAALQEEIQHVYVITNPKLTRPSVSSTFHGRDVFAPAAAHLANGTPPSKFGSETHSYMIPTFAEPHFARSELAGEVLHIDNFGNIITNISKENFDRTGITENSELDIKLGATVTKLKLCSTYADADTKTALILIGSHNFLEIAVNQDSASERFKTKVGDRVIISL